MYHLVTDLATLASLAEEATAMSWRKGDAARPGAVFKGTNRNGFRRRTTTCTVTDAAPGRVFGFDVQLFRGAGVALALSTSRPRPTAQGEGRSALGPACDFVGDDGNR